MERSRRKREAVDVSCTEGRKSVIVYCLPGPLERDDFSSKRHLALSFCLSMIFSENRYPLFRIML
jgi:hypothetical protein